MASLPSGVSTMKAWQYSSIIAGDLSKSLTLNRAAARPSTSLSPNQVAVEVIATSLNPVDHKLVELPLVGKYIVKMPASPGNDYSGRVTAVGSGITDLKSGDLCFGRLDKPTQFGTMGQFIVAPKEGAVPLPKGVEPEAAASIGTAGLTAYQCIAPNVKNGDRIFINGGSGGTGAWGIQIAKTLGCQVTTSCSTGNIGLCKELGADEVLDYKVTSITEALAKKGPRFDLVVDNVGTPNNLYSRSHEFLKPEGKFVQVGAGTSFGDIKSLMSRMMYPGFLGGGKRPYQFLGVANKREQFVQMGTWVQEGKLKPVIDERFKFEDAPKAIARVKTGRAKGKVVINMTE